MESLILRRIAVMGEALYQYYSTEVLGLLWTLSNVWYVEEKDHKVSETGSVSIFRWMGQDKPTQLGPLERARSPHPPEDGDRSSLRNVVVFCLLHTRRWMESKISPIVLYNIHHRQNPFKPILFWLLSVVQGMRYINHASAVVSTVNGS
jgi:hypothetical protein